MNGELQTVDGADTALTALGRAPGDEHGANETLVSHFHDVLGLGHLLITADGDGADLLSTTSVPGIFFHHTRIRFPRNPPRSDERARITLLATRSMPIPSRLRAVCRSNRRCQTYVVLLTELLAEGSAHDRAALTGGGREVSL